MMHDEGARRVRSHATDEFEKLRTSQVRLLQGDLEWLTNAQEALERDRLNIVKERLEIVIAGHRQELQRLRNLRPTF